ncbi:MAG: hypothetical protein QOK37_2201 [Thermoanaerobaculia bacterium]|jgi:uncharacterized membrane protein|nr:hypothetical protein [Thermoanaerobaculia bacterium]
MSARLFAVAALIIGLAYVVVTPPFAVPDEQSHFWRAMAIAHGHFVATHGLDTTLVAKSTQTFAWVMARTEPRESLREKLRIALPFDGRNAGPVRFGAWYTPLPYAAASVVAALPLRPVIVFYGGRVANLLAAVFLIALAIRVAPQHGAVIAAVGLLPMTLYELGSWSADAATIALAWLFLALLLEPPRRVGFVAVAGLAVGLCKPAYFLIALLAFVSKFRWRDRVAILSATAAGTLLSVIAARLGAYNAREGLPVDAAAQIRCIAAAPFHFASVALHDLSSNGRFYIEEMIGRFGANELKLSPFVITIEIILLVVVALTTGVALRARTRVTAVMIAAVTAGGVLLSQYLIWSIVCGDTIEGVQGRYFLEILPLVMVPFALPRTRWRHAGSAILIVALVCNGMALTTLVLRYW